MVIQSFNMNKPDEIAIGSLDEKPPLRVSFSEKNIKKPTKLKGIKKFKKDNFVLKGIFETFYEYCVMTRVNGMYYLAKGITTGFSRLLWSVAPILVFVLGLIMLVLLYFKYLDSPTRMTIGKPIPILHVPFPGVTICHPQNVMDYKIKKFMDARKLQPLVDRRVLEKALPIIGGLTERQWIPPHKNDIENLQQFFILNNLTIEDAINELGSVCTDFILKCRWAGVKFPCFQNHEYLMFKPSTSHLGACCAFNYNPDNMDYVPFASNTFGIRGGLSFIGTGAPQITDAKSGAFFSAGFEVMVHHPKDFSTEAAGFVLVKGGHETYIDVYPTDSRCSNQVLKLPFSQRKCIIAQDLNDIPTNGNYRQPECMLKCYRETVHDNCQCHPYQLPRDLHTKIRDCGIPDLKCFYDNYFTFKKLKCNCLPACSDVTYKVNQYVTDFKAANFSYNELYSDYNLTDSEFIVHVYLTGQSAFSNRKIVVMSWVSLLSNLGGVFNLCFGMSLLSLIEILYYATVRYYSQYNRLKSKKDDEIIDKLQRF